MGQSVQDDEDNETVSSVPEEGRGDERNNCLAYTDNDLSKKPILQEGVPKTIRVINAYKKSP